MAWRGLHLTQPSRLSFADGQVVVTQADGNVRVALEDLAWIILDSQQTTVTAKLLSACMDAGVAIVITDRTHTPSGVAIPFHTHFRQSAVASRQIAITAPFKKRLWQTIVKRKIDNQAAVLLAFERPGAATLKEMARWVRSGDASNVEAQAARFYWSHLWRDFRREDTGDRRNGLLNYGYAVIRSAIARSLVASGLLPTFGLKHANGANAFNLADDFLEPFRPFVDMVALRTFDSDQRYRGNLTVDDRRAMAGVMLMDARIGDDTVSMLVAIERTTNSLLRAIEGRGQILELPSILP